MGARNLVPLIILLVLVAVLGVVGYVVYTIVQNVSKNTRANMERKHLMFTKDGMKVEVKELCDEEYKDRSQSVLVNMWNNTSFPAYKSRLWDMSGKDQNHNHGHGHGAEHLGAEKRKPYSK